MKDQTIPKGLTDKALDDIVRVVQQYEREYCYVGDTDYPEGRAEIRSAIESAPRGPTGQKPLTAAQMEKGREAIFSTGNPFCPCDSKTFRKVAEWVERYHGIGGTLSERAKP